MNVKKVVGAVLPIPLYKKVLKDSKKRQVTISTIIKTLLEKEYENKQN